MEFVQGSRVAEIVPLHMSDGDCQDFTLRTGVSERSSRILDAHLHRLAHVLQSGIPHKGPGQKPRFTKDLETIANAKNEAPAVGKTAHRFHHRRKLRNRASPQVIAKSKSPGNNDGIAVL